jgi:hypothetical protein
MRTTLFTGLALVVAGVALVFVSSGLDLELESAALLGIAIGAVLALVPDPSPIAKVGAFLAGVLIAWVGYLVRTAVLPDTTSGRAVTLALVVALCVALAAVTRNRAPLWAALLGVAALVGAYETTYDVSPPEVMDSSITAMTQILLATAVGFLAAALVAPQARPVDSGAAKRRSPKPADDDTTKLDALMEDAR